jgi:hypothetical protein
LFDLLHRYNKTFPESRTGVQSHGHTAGGKSAGYHPRRRALPLASGPQDADALHDLQVMPQIFPFLLNPEVMTLLAQQSGQVLDIKAVLDDISDALNVGEMQWFRAMNPQEQQQQVMMNPNIIKAQTAQQMQSQRLEAQGQHQEAAGDSKLLAAVMPIFAKNHGVQKQGTGFDPEPPQKPTAKKK